MSRAWMPMYWGDYLADTPHFSNAEHGAYLLLIAFYWCNGGLPADDDAIRRIAKCSPHQWKTMRTILQKKFSGNGDWKHKRIDAELAQVVEKSEAARARAMRRWQCYSHSHSQSEKIKKERETRAGARGTRLTSDWWPTTADVEYALAHGLTLDRVNTESEKFRNYWTAKAGQAALKLDWGATWQNWVLRATEAENGKVRSQKQSLVDRVKGFADRARAYETAKNAGSADEPF